MNGASGTYPTSQIISTRQWNVSLYQRFRHNEDNRQYVITRTKAGKTSDWAQDGYKNVKAYRVEEWRQLKDAEEAREAINMIARFYSRLHVFTQFFETVRAS